MKIKNSILAAMTIGIAISTATSACEKIDVQRDLKDDNYQEQHQGDAQPESSDNGAQDPEYCPMCGLG